VHAVMWGVTRSPSAPPCSSPSFLLLIFSLNLSKKQTSGLVWWNLKGFRFANPHTPHAPSVVHHPSRDGKTARPGGHKTDFQTAITDKLTDLLDRLAKGPYLSNAPDGTAARHNCMETDDHYATKRTNGRDCKTVPPIRTDGRQKLPGKTGGPRRTTSKRKRWTTAMENYRAATRNSRAGRMAKLTDKRDRQSGWQTKAVHNIGQEVMRCAWQPEREAPCGPPKQSFGFFYYLYPIKFAMAEVGGVRKDSSSSPALPLARRCV